jgi:hypothetical protein
MNRVHEPRLKGKSYDIPKRLLWDAWLKVKDNGGAAGADGVTIEQFEEDLSGNLFPLWNRMSSGSYFPGPVRAVEIPKKGGPGCSAYRRSPHTTRSCRRLLDSLVVTHPFHPLRGERLVVLFVRRVGAGRVYVCEGGPLGSVALPEDATDRGPEPAERPLSIEVLAALVALLADLTGEWGVAR